MTHEQRLTICKDAFEFAADGNSDIAFEIFNMLRNINRPLPNTKIRVNARRSFKPVVSAKTMVDRYIALYEKLDDRYGSDNTTVANLYTEMYDVINYV